MEAIQERIQALREEIIKRHFEYEALIKFAIENKISIPPEITEQ